MIQHSSDAGVPLLDVSPIRSSKHEMTPLKIKRKTFRRDQGADVHAACSTPNRLQAGNLCSSFNSPSDSFPSSQDNRPDVIWDFTSPKHPGGDKKKEIICSVDEFLKNLNHTKSPECNTQNSHYIRLLEKWMAKQNTPVRVKKPVRTAKRVQKTKTRQIYKDMKQFTEFMKQNNEDKSKTSDKECIADANNLPNGDHLNQSCSSVNKKSFLEGDSAENDAIEALWGEADNSFIVKATQHLEVSSLKYNAQVKNMGIVSTIPETMSSTCIIPKNEKQEPTLKNSNKQILDSDLQAQVLLTQIRNCNFDSDSDFDDFENGFIMGDDDLGLIPDEVLSGTFKDSENATEKADHIESEERNQESKNLTATISSATNEAKLDGKNRSCEISFSCTESNKVPSRATNMSEVELFNNFEDESFGDESILCKPEVLSWIEEVEHRESKLYPSQNCTLELSQGPKCSPEEIEKKKDAAKQRLNRNRLKNKK